MFVQTSLPSSIEAALPFVSDYGKQDLCDWMLDAETWQKCRKCDEDPQARYIKSNPTGKEEENAEESCSLIDSRTYSKLSNVSTMCSTSAPNFVYKRRKLQRNSGALFSALAATNIQGSGSCSFISSSEGPSLVAKKDNLAVHIGAPDSPTYVCRNNPLCTENPSISNRICKEKFDLVPCRHITNPRGLEILKSEPTNRSAIEEEPKYTAPAPKPAKEYYSINDSCSSSKSIMKFGLASMKTEVDDTGECSSCEYLPMGVLAEDVLEKEICISILRSHGLLEGVRPVETCDSVDILVANTHTNCTQFCKICGDSENPINMLICDHCEEAFHVSCCNPKIKKIPVDAWYCQPCMKKKHKISPETAMGKSFNPKSKIPAFRNRMSREELGPILYMLRDTLPYTSDVRIGRAFQVDVPDWSSPIPNDSDCIGEPLELNPAECVNLHGWNSNKSSTPTSIGNWLQCREVLYDNKGEGTICGKWRRAPLFEVQTDNWDCSRSFLWDPIHSDCAVPQELETDQVLMHLKYVELLRPRLDAKKKPSCFKSDGA